MALSAKLQKLIKSALPSKTEADEAITAISRQAGAVPDIATADATDLPTAIALANATKAKVNALLAALRAAGLIS